MSRREKKKIKLLKKQGKRIPSNRVVSLYLGSIRHLFNEAKKQYNDYDRDIIPIPHSPFENFKIPKQEATRKRAISAKDILKIYEMPYLLDYKGRERVGRFNLAKDCFILSFGLIGMNSADLYSCEDIKEDVITYFRAKTSARRNDKAKMKVKVMEVIEKVGLKAVMRDGIDYEFTIVFDINMKHQAIASKDRTNLFMGKPDFTITPTTGQIIFDWCNDGVNVEMIRQQINKAKSIEELTAIYHKYPEWYQQLTSDFMQKKMQLQEEKNKPSINYSPNFTRYGSNAATACQG